MTARVGVTLSGRYRLQRLIAGGRVRVDGGTAKPAARLRGGEALDVEIPDPEPSGLVAQDLPLAVLHEDADLLVCESTFRESEAAEAREHFHMTAAQAAALAAEGGVRRLALTHFSQRYDDSDGFRREAAALHPGTAKTRGRSP